MIHARISWMADVAELRVALTVEDLDAAVALYRDALGLEQLADWTSENGRVIVLSAGRATLELFDEAQAAYVDSVEVGRRARALCGLRSRCLIAPGPLAV